MTLVEHYKIVHQLTSAQQYSYSEILDMLPYERDIATSLIMEDIERANQKQNNK